jgi:hypothetical protein
MITLTALVLATFAWSAERDADEAANAAISDASDSEGKAYIPARPAKMPDLTKGDPLPPPGKEGVILWNMGATGIIGVKNGGNAGDQVQVVSIYPGSPAEGKIFPGDVLLATSICWPAKPLSKPRRRRARAFSLSTFGVTGTG